MAGSTATVRRRSTCRRPNRWATVGIRRRIHAGEWVVDLRSRTAFARGQTGTVNVEIGDSFATYLGWTMRWGTPVTLGGDPADEVAEAQRQMVRIGIDRAAGAADGGLARWSAGGDVRSYRSVSFAELADARTDPAIAVLDVRRDDEWADGHLFGAVHIPLHDLEDRLDEPSWRGVGPLRVGLLGLHLRSLTLK